MAASAMPEMIGMPQKELLGLIFGPKFDLAEILQSRVQ